MVKIEDEGEATARVEAALYSAGRPLKIEELIRASGTESRTKTYNILNTLIRPLSYLALHNYLSLTWSLAKSEDTTPWAADLC